MVNMCKDHGLLVKVVKGLIYCWYCGKEIPLNKLKKRRGSEGQFKR